MATKTSKATKTVGYSGVVTRCKVLCEREPDYNYTHRYTPNGEFYQYILDCALQTDEGETIYFKTPGSPMTVANCPGAAVVTFRDAVYHKETDRYVFPEDHPWFTKVGDKAVATPGEPSDVRLESKIRIGQRVTIQGRIKADRVSKVGKPYKVLNYVKRLQDKERV